MVYEHPHVAHNSLPQNRTYDFELCYLCLLRGLFLDLHNHEHRRREYFDERERVANEIGSTSQTLGTALLKYILITFHNVYLEHESFCEITYLVSSMQYNRSAFERRAGGPSLGAAKKSHSENR